VTESTTPPNLLDVLRLAATIAFVVLLPFFTVGTALRWVVEDRQLMLDGFRQNGVAQVTGLDAPQLERIATTFVDYFKAPPGRLDIPVTLQGRQVSLFNEKETAHMEDVQRLVQWFLMMQIVAGVVVAARIGLAVVDRDAGLLGRDLLLSAAWLMLVVFVVGVLAAVDFTWLWLQFHKIAFRNDLWALDPNTDFLIMLFPEPAWLAYTVRFVGAVASATVASAAVGFALIRLGR
jgi:integral membrane protein (TIGR01906 family)